jgi:enamine deaminase RidA (YjgF/YER057c/UK114 family)
VQVTHLNPRGLPDWRSLFSQVVIAEGPALRIVAISGQVGVDQREKLSGDGGFSAQTEKAFANLMVALSAARCSHRDVMKLTIYVVGYDQKKIGPIQEAVREHFGAGELPACTLVGVQALARPEFQIEVEALAITDSDRASSAKAASN